MSRAAPQARHVMLGGLQMLELIRGVLESRVGFVADFIDPRNILESLLEEFFYGGSFQDQFYEQLSAYSIATDQINFLRREIIASLSQQVRQALGDIVPANRYSFTINSAGDVMVSEVPPVPVFGGLRLAG